MGELLGMETLWGWRAGGTSKGASSHMVWIVAPRDRLRVLHLMGTVARRGLLEHFQSAEQISGGHIAHLGLHPLMPPCPLHSQEQTCG